MGKAQARLHKRALDEKPTRLRCISFDLKTYRIHRFILHLRAQKKISTASAKIYFENDTLIYRYLQLHSTRSQLALLLFRFIIKRRRGRYAEGFSPRENELKRTTPGAPHFRMCNSRVNHFLV